jgi:hypothetical protein
MRAPRIKPVEPVEHALHQLFIPQGCNWCLVPCGLSRRTLGQLLVALAGLGYGELGPDNFPAVVWLVAVPALTDFFNSR